MHEGYTSAISDGQGDNLYDAWLNSPRFGGDMYGDEQPMAPGSGMGMPHMAMDMPPLGMSVPPMGMGTAHLGMDMTGMGMGTAHLGMDMPYVPPWDPAEELAYLLRASMPEEPPVDAGVPEEPIVSTTLPQPAVGVDHTCTRPPARPPYPAGHRRVRRRPPIASLLRTASFSIGALSAVIVAMVSVFGGIVAYAPLRDAAIDYELSAEVVRWWPLLVYGPWMVASLSILRAALHRRRAVHSWCVVLFFCFVAVLLCVVQAPRSVTGMAAACLPSLAALTCFQQLVRQVTLTRPPRQPAPRHRQGTSRHRQSTPAVTRRREETGPSRQEPVTAQGCPAHSNPVVTGTLARHHTAPGGLGVGGRTAGLRMP